MEDDRSSLSGSTISYADFVEVKPGEVLRVGGRTVVGSASSKLNKQEILTSLFPPPIVNKDAQRASLAISFLHVMLSDRFSEFGPYLIAALQDPLSPTSPLHAGLMYSLGDTITDENLLSRLFGQTAAATITTPKVNKEDGNQSWGIFSRRRNKKKAAKKDKEEAELGAASNQPGNLGDPSDLAANYIPTGRQFIDDVVVELLDPKTSETAIRTLIACLCIITSGIIKKGNYITRSLAMKSAASLANMGLRPQGLYQMQQEDIDRLSQLLVPGSPSLISLLKLYATELDSTRSTMKIGIFNKWLNLPSAFAGAPGMSMLINLCLEREFSVMSIVTAMTLVTELRLYATNALKYLNDVVVPASTTPEGVIFLFHELLQPGSYPEVRGKTNSAMITLAHYLSGIQALTTESTWQRYGLGNEASTEELRESLMMIALATEGRKELTMDVLRAITEKFDDAIEDYQQNTTLDVYGKPKGRTAVQSLIGVLEDVEEEDRRSRRPRYWREDEEADEEDQGAGQME